MAIIAPTYEVSTTELTNQSVIVTATFDPSATDVTNSWSYQAASSTEPTEWTVYEGPITVDVNGTVYLMTRKNDLSEIVTAECVISNIDKVKPEITVSADITDLTNKDVVVSATFTDNSDQIVEKLYSVDGGQVWAAYDAEAGVKFEANGTVLFKATDKAGNTTVTEAFKVENIDKEKPTIVVAADPAALTNQDVKLTATFSDNSQQFASKQYSLDGGTTWADYDAEAGVKLEANGTVQFKAVDAAGNASDVATFTVDYIDKVAPDAPTPAASTTAPTNQPVTVTATFSEDSVGKKYSLDGGTTWTDYTVGVEFTENGSVVFKAIDEAGNASETTYEVKNIDKVAPVVTPSADITAPTNTDVVVTVTVTDDASQIVSTEYKLVNGDWTTYSAAGVKFEENGTVLFRATDAAGNTSEAVEFKVENIDKVAPDAPTAQASTTDPTNQPVTVTATFSADSVQKLFSKDEGEWLAYDAQIGVVFEDNGKVSFKGIDAAGNASQVVDITVSNIDLVAPDAPTFVASTTDPTNQNVTVTATFSADSAVKQYSLDGGTTWIAYEAPVVMKQNGTVQFKGTDAAGNESPVASCDVANIDKAAPTITVEADITAPTNDKVVLTPTFSDNVEVVVKKFSLDASAWQDYVEPIAVTENTTVSFLCSDTAGNISQVVSYTVTNIDKIAPVVTPSADITTITNTDVVVSVDVTDNASQIVSTQFSIDGGETWADYNAQTGVKFEQNGAVLFKATDAAGNTSDPVEYKVENIDKVAPEAPTAEAAPTAPTNQPVTVTATFSADSVKKEFSVDGGTTWADYDAETGVILDDNGTVQFRGIDAATNVSDVTSITITNIDKVAPEKPVAAASTTDPTNQPVTVTATFSEDSVKQEFSIDAGTTWADYDAEAGVVLQDNGTVSFRGTDAAGNVSQVTSLEVTNIDLVAPDAPTDLTPSTTAPTKFDVTVTAKFSDDSVLKQYSFDEGEEKSWIEYPDNGVIVKDNNTTVFFRGVDAAGNASESVSYKVTNIDKAAPTITVTASTTDPTNQSVTVTAVFEDDNGVVSKAYSFDGGLTWFDYTDPIVVDGNITISFLGQDGVGNFTITAYTVDNIDKIPPVAPVASADYTTPTNTDVVVTAVFSDDSVVQEYSIDGGTVWSAYDAETGVVFEENGTVLFRGIDAATNVSDVTSYTVDVIDKVAPDAPVVTLTPAPGKYTNLDVTVTATFSEDTVTKQYTVDGGETWLVFADEGVAISENVTVSVRGLDAAGNASELVTNVIDYIDKIVPTLTVSADITVPTTEIVSISATVTDNTDYYRDIVEQVPVLDETTGEQVVDGEGNPIFEDKVTGQELVTNTVIKYSRDGKSWLTYKGNPIKFTRNGQIYFYAEDEAGNRTETVTYDVWNIDKIFPTLTLSADITTPTNGIVQVSAEASDNFDIYDTETFTNLTVEYSRDKKTWLTYKDNPIKFTRNGEIHFRATDAAGNQVSQTYVVDNIDKVPPAAPTAAADITEPTNQDVTVTATFSADTVSGEYSLDGGETWEVYDAETGVVMEDNGTVEFRGYDAAGNVSKATSFTVSNIDKIPPEAPAAEASTVDPTNQPVTVMAVFSEDTVSGEYSLDGEEWIAYDAEKGVVFEDNGSVFFRGYDAVGNVSDATEYVVENIDLIPPEAPTASADITDPTNQDVTVTPVFSEDTVSGEYSLDGGETWEVYDAETGVVMEDNGTVEFRGYDAAGNVSEVTSFEVTNIDKIPPAAPVATADVTEPTRDAVTVTATFSEDTVFAEYSTDGEEWYAYDPEQGVVFEENGVVGFRGYDAVGNVSEITEYVVTNIDLVPPEAPIVLADVTTDTNRSVALTAVFDEDAVTKQYSLDGEEWLAYDAEKGVVADENGKFFFRGIDAVGNISEVTEYDVTNIDKVAPVAPVVSADVTVATKDPVTVTAVFAEDSVSNLYSLDEGKTWQEYTEGIKFEKNGLVMFISHDLAGNFSFNGYLVENIDLVAPDAPQLLSVEPAEFTNTAIVVKADFTEDSAVKEYSLDNQTWLAYDAEKGVTVDANGSIFFRAADSVGNVSDVAEFKIWNIDTTAPEAATNLNAVVSGQTVALVWTPSLDDLSGVAEYTLTYSHDDKSFTVKTSNSSFLIENADYGTWSWTVTATDAAGNTSAVATGADFVVSEEPGPQPGPTPVATLAKNDIDGNGISDVLFQWTAGDGQIGFWMNGTNEWHGQAQPHNAGWGVIGTYDMTADGKADLIMVGSAQIVEQGGLYIGYYIDSVDTAENWRTIGFLSNSENTWNILAGNLTGSVGKNSIVWYSQDAYSLGIWKDGEEEWVALSNEFGGEDWTIAGIGDFTGDGKDTVLMSYSGGKQFYSVGIDGTAVSLGEADWSGWDVATIGDFAGDGKDDIILFNQDAGSMVMCADGNVDQYINVGQLDAKDWFIVGCGDYNNDQKDDLLVRQFSTGMLGYYSGADQSKWVELGRGVDTDWTVIA
ncbi:MAG: hypothetical protein PUC15_10850 [Lentisphaeria bacterium]|nr:hypothetical protein [Lentisphaeria bacterium]